VLPDSDQPPGTDAPNPANTANISRNDLLPNGYNDGSAVHGNQFENGFNYLTDVGAYVHSAGPYGTFDQAGNVGEWNETLTGPTMRGYRGGTYGDGIGGTAAATRGSGDHMLRTIGLGFRVASVIPEPTSQWLCSMAACSVLCGMRRRRRDSRTAIVHRRRQRLSADGSSRR
jgi:formylglycine-generating enzyme required for sulfatase activity